MRILFVKLSAIGDVVQALPVLAALRRRYPDAHISWVVGEVASDLLETHPLVDEVLIYPRRHWGRLSRRVHTWPMLFAEVGSFTRRLRGETYDVAVDLQGLMKSGIIVRTAKARRKLGFSRGREGSSIFLNETLPPYDPDEHAVLRYLRLARHLDAPTDEAEFPLAVGPEERAQARAWLDEAGWEGRPFLVLNPGAAWVTKRWVAEGFAEVADHCVKEWGLGVVIAGGSGDPVLAEAIRAGMEQPVLDLTGRTGLRQLAALYQQARVVVSTDTGPMHLAAAAGAPVVALFGPTAPWRTGPFGDRHHVLRLDLRCSPCFRRRCEDLRCMRGIRPQEVIDAVGRVMESCG